MTSPDGTSWTLANSGTTIDLYDVVFNDGKFVAVGGVYAGSGIILTSSDGQTWNAKTFASSGIINKIVFGNNIYVALTQKGTWTSSDVDNWTYHPVALGSGEVFTSITFGNGKFMACSDYSFWPGEGGMYWVYVSEDASSWNSISNGASLLDIASNTLSYENGIFIATTWFFSGFNIYNDIITSLDGTKWIYKSLSHSILSEVTYGNGIYATASSSGGLVYISEDVINWAPISTGVAGNFCSINYLNDSFFIVGNNPDGTGLIVQSEPDHSSEPPVANAGMDQTIHAGGMATLDGSGSSDPNGYYPLTYSWSIFSMPAGSTAVLSDPTVVNPSFTLDREGSYTVQLMVTNKYGIRSAPVYTVVSTVNSAPVAEAGDDQAITVHGMTISLNGTQSYDPDGDSITYAWNILEKPAGSYAHVSNPAAVSPTIIPDVYGTYVLRLTVTDFWGASNTDTVTLSFNNLKPVANAGQNQSIILGSTSIIDGSDSTDANGDYLTYFWSIISAPAGSAAAIVDPFAIQTSLMPDLSGTYVLSLTVNDGLVNSDPSNITIVVAPNLTPVIQEVHDAIDTTNGFSPTVFKNKNMTNTLTGKLNSIILMAQQGQYSMALDSLQNDIMKKTDGCITSGAPDNNDWIQNCAAQHTLYNELLQVKTLLQGLM